ncbi:MAG TPA: Rieske (2Fe-2S) protein [Actinotalea sp.]|nr:Rieske (2Fe-2S) protein [Actinotalea sp.]
MTVTRRGFLAGSAAAAGVGALAACAPSGSSPEPTSSPGAPLVALADVPVGSAVITTAASGDEVVVAQPQAGTVVAFSAACTHQGCIVRVDGGRLACPCHGSVFDAATGAVEQGPAARPLVPYAVEVQGDAVVEG